MRSRWSVVALSCLILTTAGLVGCAGEGNKKADEARLAQLSQLREQQATLSSQRAETEALRQKVAQAREAEGRESGEATAGGPTLDELEAQLQQQESAVIEATDAFNGQLVSFINADPPVAGEPMSETQLAGVRMKTGEDMLVAREYIDKGGDYKRAIDIYEQLLQLDPDNESLRQAKAQAEVDRYMSRERFDQVKKGMTQQEVRALLGQVNLRNIRKYPDRDVEAWFYPKEVGAAGVFFNRRKGELRVYQLNFDAVKGQGEDAVEDQG